MHKVFSILFFLVIWDNLIFANVGGVTPRPGIIGDPIIWDLTNISIESEDLYLRFFERDGKKICFFSATYFLQSDTIQEIEVNSIFYGLRANNIEIFYNSKLLTTSIDSSKLHAIDDVIYKATQRRTSGEAIWFDWQKLTKKGFKFIFNSNNSNVLKITGEIELKPDMTWYGFATPPIYAKHPFLNKDANKLNETFHYLITPIETWKSVGEIRIKLEYPENWLLEYKGKSKASRSKMKKIITENIVIKDEYPKIFTIDIIKKMKLHIGGASMGVSTFNKNDFSARLGWELGINHNSAFFINTIFAIDYETDFSDFHQLSLTAIPTTPWTQIIIPSIGLGVGIPVRYVNNNLYSGIRLRVDFSLSLFYVSLNFDYFPTLNNGYTTNYYGLTF